MRHLALVVVLMLTSVSVAPVWGTGVSQAEQVASLVTHGCSSARTIAQVPADHTAPASTPSPASTPAIP
ncbi:MAG: hypothetical protein M3160_01440, partial [Candidatus Eremiobacteraeota bacterium]|nr:hypothetical protein [Candidatus Eremiobacteraeota bacterium]